MYTWVSVYIVFLVIIINNNNTKKTILHNKLRRRKKAMTNELVKKFIGKQCIINTGSMGGSIIGTIIEVKDNWIEVQTKKNNELHNLDFVVNIKLK